LIHAGYRKCPECGYEFPPNEDGEKLSATASTAGVISGQVDYTDYDVLETFYAVHEKRYADPDTPKTMRVDYQVGFNEFKSEWVCPEHTGYAREKFLKWWRERAALGCPVPDTAREAAELASEGLLAEPESITVKSVAGEKFDRITGWRLKPRPIMHESGDDSADADDWHSNSPEDIGFKTEPFDEDSIPF
jgi:DNA repair protein RadD